MTRLWSRLLLGAFAALGTVRPAHATPENSEGFGSRETALAGAVSAHVPNGSAVFYNPAELVQARTSELMLGYAAVGYALSANGGHGIPMRHALEASVLGRGSFLDVPVAFGLGVGLANGHLSRSESLSAAEPRWIQYDGLPELVNVGADLALRPLPELSLGAGVGFLAAMNGHFDVTGTARVSDGMGAEYDSQLRHAVNADLLAVRYPTLGLSWRPYHALALALSYRGRAELDERISGTLAGVVDGGLLQVPIRYDFVTESVIAFQPRELTFGANFRQADTRFELDLGWQDWSSYPSPVARSGSQVTADLPPGFTLGLPPSSALAPKQSAHFKSRVVPRVSVEQRLLLARHTALLLRGGYAYEASPLSSPEPAHLVDSARHLLTLGAAVALRHPLTLSRLELATHLLWAHQATRPLLSSAAAGPPTFLAAGHSLGAGMTLTVGFR
jgi:hypothetical protein